MEVNEGLLAFGGVGALLSGMTESFFCSLTESCYLCILDMWNI